jgi:hypothetical protein
MDDRLFESRQGPGIFLFTTTSRPALGPTQILIQWVPGSFSLGVKRPGCEADHSPQSSAKVKNARSYASTPPIRLHGVVLDKAARIAQCYGAGIGLEDRGFESRQGLGILFTIASSPALGPTQPPIQWVPGALSLGVKRPGREADHSLQSSATSRMRGDIPPLPNTPSWCGAQLRTGMTLPLPYLYLCQLHRLQGHNVEWEDDCE